MGSILAKLFPAGPLIELGHVECCNTDEVRSSSSSESWATAHSEQANTKNKHKREASQPDTPVKAMLEHSQAASQLDRARILEDAQDMH